MTIGIRILAVSAITLFLIAPVAASAAGTDPGGLDNTQSGVKMNTGGIDNTQQPVSNAPGSETTLINPLGSGSSLSGFIANILGLVTRIGSIFVILMLVYVGFLFVAARGEPGELQKARQALLYTLIGALILLGAQALAAGIQATTQALSG